LSAWNNLAPPGQISVKFDIWIFLKRLEKIQVLLNSDKNDVYLKTTRYFWSYITQFFLEWEIFQTQAVEEIKTHSVFNNFFF
jgi:hypothetical protein